MKIFSVRASGLRMDPLGLHNTNVRYSDFKDRCARELRASKTNSGTNPELIDNASRLSTPNLTTGKRTCCRAENASRPMQPAGRYCGYVVTDTNSKRYIRGLGLSRPPPKYIATLLPSAVRGSNQGLSPPPSGTSRATFLPTLMTTSPRAPGPLPSLISLVTSVTRSPDI